jgi:hypothetical protein
MTEIRKGLELDIYGFSGTALNKDYAGKAFQLMDKMWKLVKGNKLANKGKNVWIYESDDRVFAGVELMEARNSDNGMERKLIQLAQYGYYKHIGPHRLIKQAGEKMKSELKIQGFEAVLPYIEIYGHWDNDESKLETDLLISVV